jgi:chromosome segregation ATPase
MADVIFNGSETRKPVGFAEVSLTFTDCAEELGIDWHDVRVTRRVYRDGNSEYLLNKTVLSTARYSKSIRRHRYRASCVLNDGTGQDRYDPEFAP